MELQTLIDWFMNLGTAYGVDPIIFGAIYVGAIPFFTLSIGWLIRNLRRKRSITFPLLSSAFFFVSAYLYLLVIGENIPVWVYVLLIIVIGWGAYSTFNKVRRKVAEVPAADMR